MHKLTNRFVDEFKGRQLAVLLDVVPIAHINCRTAFAELEEKDLATTNIADPEVVVWPRLRIVPLVPEGLVLFNEIVWVEAEVLVLLA